MDIEEYVKRLKELTTDAVNKSYERAILLSANELLAKVKGRIQRDGKDSSGQSMSPYSEKPAYFIREDFVKKSSFSKHGKKSKADFKNGGKRKSMYLEHGYKQFREVQGRQTKVKDITMSGDLMKSYVLGQSQGTAMLGIDSNVEINKRKGLEKQNGGKILTATNIEIGDYEKSVRKQANDFIYEILKR